MSMLRILATAPKAQRREIFDSDIRRVVITGWLLNALAISVTILLLPGGLQPWKMISVSLIVIAAITAGVVEKKTGVIHYYWILAVVLYLMPIVFSSQSSEPWVSYGLIIICGTIFASAVDNLRIALPVIYLHILILYVVSKLNFPAMSDNVDNQLLSSFFATSWTFIVGIGAVYVRRAYLQYYDEIESTVKKVENLHLLEAKKLTKLNMEDHLNGQLHGTVLNTLIAIKNSPQLLKDRNKIWQYLSNDLAQLDKESLDTNRKLEIALETDMRNSVFRNLKFSSELRLDRKLNPIVYEVTREIVRELALNAKKHSAASECSVLIEQIESPINPDIDTSIVNRDIVITFKDNSPLFLEPNEKKNFKFFKSESVSRLLSNIEGRIAMSIENDQLVQRIIFRHPESPLTFIDQVQTLRRESIRYVSKGFISLTILYAVVCLPAYIYLGISLKVAVLFIAQILFLIFSLRNHKYSLPLAALGSLSAIAIFPVFALENLECQDVQYLPWLFNGVIGSAFFVTLLTKNKVLKWIPIVLFYISCLIIENKLPQECKNLLDGSTPAIIIIAIFSAGISLARTRTKRAQEGFVAQSMSEYKDIEETKLKVSTERERALAELSRFIEELRGKDLNASLMLSQIQRLILILRTFLICSEYFYAPPVVAIYEFAMNRNIQGIETQVEISTQDFSCKVAPKDFERLLRQISIAIKKAPISIHISRAESLLVTISTVNGSTVKPMLLQKSDLKIQLVP